MNFVDPWGLNGTEEEKRKEKSNRGWRYTYDVYWIGTTSVLARSDTVTVEPPPPFYNPYLEAYVSQNEDGEDVFDPAPDPSSPPPCPPEVCGGNEEEEAIAQAEEDRTKRSREQEVVAWPAIEAGGNAILKEVGIAGIVGGVSSPSGAGRGGTKLKPDPDAQGPHSTFKRDPATGKVTGHAEWDATGNPVKRTDIVGSAHGPVQTPHTHEYGPPNINPATGKSYPGNEVRVRPATPDEIPR